MLVYLDQQIKGAEGTLGLDKIYFFKIIYGFMIYPLKWCNIMNLKCFKQFKVLDFISHESSRNKSTSHFTSPHQDKWMNEFLRRCRFKRKDLWTPQRPTQQRRNAHNSKVPLWKAEWTFLDRWETKARVRLYEFCIAININRLPVPAK